MTHGSPTQLTLGISLQDEANFGNFLITPENEQLLQTLQDTESAPKLIYLWGAAGSGRTHLTQALCHQNTDQGRAALYLPMTDRQEIDESILQGANTLSLLCLDDADELCGDKKWEAAFFRAFNDVMESDSRLLITADVPPQQLALALPDLHSRLQLCLVFQLQEVGDEEKKAVLQLRANNRGMKLEVAVADYIVQRADRNLNSLMAILDDLDRASLEKGRRITIPLVRDIMQW